jgi:hypothetical protein
MTTYPQSSCANLEHQPSHKNQQGNTTFHVFSL